jgi:hypothetical protein
MSVRVKFINKGKPICDESSENATCEGFKAKNVVVPLSLNIHQNHVNA